MSKEKSVTVSLRITDLAYKALQDESKKMNVSLNTLANQIFLSFATYDRYLSRFGMVKVADPHAQEDNRRGHRCRDSRGRQVRGEEPATQLHPEHEGEADARQRRGVSHDNGQVREHVRLQRRRPKAVGRP